MYPLILGGDMVMLVGLTEGVKPRAVLGIFGVKVLIGVIPVPVLTEPPVAKKAPRVAAAPALPDACTAATPALLCSYATQSFLHRR